MEVSGAWVTGVGSGDELALILFVIVAMRWPRRILPRPSGEV